MVAAGRLLSPHPAAASATRSTAAAPPSRRTVQRAERVRGLRSDQSDTSSERQYSAHASETAPAPITAK